MTSLQPPLLSLRIASIATVATGVVTVELRSTQGSDLPAFTAGAHIDLHLAPGLVRSYSLLNDQRERDRYVVAVQRDAASRGGSVHVHERLREGMALDVSPPRNHFALCEAAAHTELIAGGIGITPMLCMIRRLEALGRPWHLSFCARTRDHAAFRETLAAYGDKVRFNFDQEPGGQLLDIGAVVARAPAGTHFYCCGPLPMLAAFEAATQGLAEENVHREYFNAAPVRDAPAQEAGAYAVTLARSGTTFTVEAGQTILDKLIALDIDIAFSCGEGVCGSCETAVLEGAPAHRDMVLSKTEQAAGKTMMVCCSGSQGPRLVLDL